MADELAGRLFIELLPDVDRKKFQAAINKSVMGVEATIPTELKLKKGAAKTVVAEANAELAKTAPKPKLDVGLNVTMAAARDAIRDANLRLKESNVALPTIAVGLRVSLTEAKNAIKDANKKLKAAKAAPPKLNVQLNLTTDELEAIREVRVLTREVEAAVRANPIELTVDLDDAAKASLLAKIELLKAQASAAGLASYQRTQERLRALTEAGNDQRSLIDQRFQNQRSLMHERAEMAMRRSSKTSLRTLRNDLASFETSSARMVSRMGFVFAGFTAAIAASFAAIGVAALKSFAETETQIRRTAAVLGTDAFSETIAATNDQTKAFAAFRSEVERTDKALRNVVESVALKTVFNPTEIAAATRALAQAGLKVDEINASLLSTAQFAQNEEMLPEEAVASLVQGATAAGESLSTLNSLADKFTFVANNTTASATEMADAFANRAAPQFRAYGESVESTLTVLDLFAAAGIKGKTAGEQTGILIRFINQAAAKTPATTAAFKKYGIEIGKVNGKQVPFLKTLGQLGFLLDKTAKSGGSLARTRLQSELGLTQKSASGLNQVLPQVMSGLDGTANSADEAVAGLFRLEKQIGRSGGAVSRQSSIITNTLGFQFEQFTNQIGTLFRIAAGPTGRALTDTFREFNEQLSAGTANGNNLRDKFLEIGEAISKRVVPALRSFFFEGEGEDFLGGVVNMYRGFLIGLRNAFVEFRRSAFGEGSDKGFFTVLGEAFAAIGRFAQSTLPRIGNALGQITRFVRENESSVRLFFRAWLGAFVASKALRLFVIPIENLVTWLKNLYSASKAFLGLSVAKSLTDQAVAMRSLTTATTAQTVATNTLAAAQARQSGTSLANMIPGGGLGGKLGKLGGLGKLAKSATIVGAAVTLAIPALIGFSEGLSTSTGEADSLSIATKELGKNLGWLRDQLGAIGHPMKEANKTGEKVGKSFRSAASSILDFGVSWSALGFGDVEESGNAAASSMDKAALAALRLGDALIPDNIEKNSHEITRFGESADELAQKLSREGGMTASIDEMDLSLTRLSNTLRRSAIADAAKEQKSFADAVSGTLRFAPKQIAVAGKLTSLQKALSLSLIEVAIRGREATAAFTARQASMANIAYETGVLTGKIKDNAAWTEIASTASRFYNVNLIRLYRGQRNLNSQLQLVAAGNERAARKYIANVKLAGLETQAAKRLEFQLARTSIMRIRAAEATRIAAGMMSSRLVAAQTRFEDARASNKGAAAASAAATKAAEQAVKDLQKAFNDTSGAADGTTESATGTADAVAQVKTAAEKATEAVGKLTQTQLNSQAASVVGKATQAAANGYKATAHEAEILKRVLPSVEEQLTRQQAAVSKLDEALQALQSTQLKGTRAFSDQAFSIEQSVKGLQLQRLDLIIGGTPEEDTAIKALDDQISKLQQQTERLSLVESLQLDPLKRKLEEAFSPIRELGFDEIIKQFKSIQAQKSPLTEAIAGGENLKATLETTIKDAELRFGEAGKQVTVGFANGIKATTPQVTAAGKQSGDAALRGVNQVMAFGSPSRTMIQRGVWVTDGFVQGINSGNASVMRSGAQTMWSFLTGMRNVYENRVQPFVTSIAEWIKNNKGPVAYDATLLRPAGEAMMYGFKRGLTDGFGEIKSWVRTVGPSLATDTFPKELFIERSARFLLNNVKADSDFNPEDAFGDLTYDVLGGMGPFDQTLGFLHKSKSFADTLEMGKRLAAIYGMAITGKNEAAGHVVGSDHPKGLALDLSNSGGTDWSRSSRTPDMNTMKDDLLPYLENVFKQIIYAEKIYGVGGGPTGAGGSITNSNPHNAHVHLAWQKDIDFLRDSGKKGGTLTIPGVAQDVLEAIGYASQATKLDPRLIAAVMKQESGFRKNVVSGDGGYGLMQLTSAGLVARADQLGGRLNPRINALVGSEYLRDLINQLGSMRLGLSAYNSGPGGGERYGQVDVPAYVASVMRFFEEFKRRFGSTGNFRAQGGKVNSMTPYIVGERGQEMFIPSQNGSVVSNRDLRGLIASMQNAPAGSAGTTVYDQRQNHVYSNSTDAATVAALIDSRMRSQTVGVRR